MGQIDISSFGRPKTHGKKAPFIHFCRAAIEIWHLLGEACYQLCLLYGCIISGVQRRSIEVKGKWDRERETAMVQIEVKLNRRKGEEKVFRRDIDMFSK